MSDIEHELLQGMNHSSQARLNGKFVRVDEEIFVTQLDGKVNVSEACQAGITALVALPQLFDGTISAASGEFLVLNPAGVNAEVRQFFEETHQQDAPQNLQMDKPGVYIDPNSLRETGSVLINESVLVWKHTCPDFEVLTPQQNIQLVQTSAPETTPIHIID